MPFDVWLCETDHIEFVSQLDPPKLVFSANMITTKRSKRTTTARGKKTTTTKTTTTRVCVKFFEGEYPVEVHKAFQRSAPQLFQVCAIGAGWSIVVMEFLEQSSLRRVFLRL